MKKITFFLLSWLFFVFAAQAQFHESFDTTSLPPGWSIINNGDPNTWEFGPPPLGSPNSGAGDAHIEWGDNLGNDDYLITPQFTVISGLTDQLRFFSRNEGGIFEDQLNVRISTSGTEASDFNILLAQIIPPGEYTEYTYDLSAYEGQDIYVAFHVNTEEFRLYLDDVYVEKIPTCPKPANLQVLAVDESSAAIEWEAGAAETEWEVIYGAPGFDPNTGGTILTVTDTPETTITGLEGNTSYEVYVRAVCGVDDKSEIIGPRSFRTTCAPMNVPYLQDFESVTPPNLPLCTSVQNMGSGNNWATHNQNANGFNSIVLRYAYNTSNPANTWFFIDGLILDADEEYQISYRYGNNSTSYTERMKVAIGTIPDAGSMTQVIKDHPNISGANAMEEEVIFTVPQSGVYYIGFHAYSGTNEFYLYLDDIKVTIAPTCPEPRDIVIGDVSASTAEVSWTERSTAEAWEVIYGEAGFDPQTSGTIQAVEGSPNTILTDLQDSSHYDVYVRSVCDEDDKSEWFGPETFMTECVAGSVPFFEGFEHGYQDQESVEGCWSQAILTGTQRWTANTSQTTYNRTPRTGSWNATLRYSSEAWMFYPLQLEGGTAYQLEFYARQNGTAGTTIMAAYGTTNTAAGMTNILVEETAVVDGDYQKFLTYFRPDDSGVYYIGIKGKLTVTPWYLSVDDISVTEAPNCLPVTNLTIDELGSDFATVSWSPANEETEWEVIYGPAGFDPSTAGTTVSVSDTPQVTLSGLSDNTEYEFYVVADCGEGEESPLEGPKKFRTACTATTVPYTQDFESAVVPELPLCTSVENLGTGNTWITGNSPGSGFNSKVLRYNWNSSSPANTWFYTQGIEMNGGENYTISYRYGNSSSIYTEKMKVAYGTAPQANAMVNLIGDHPNITGGQPTTETIIFTPETSGVYYFGFHAYSAANQLNLFLDDIHIEWGPSCRDPEDFIVEGTTVSTAELSWTAYGSEIEWEVAYGNPGFDPNTGGSVLIVEEPEATITGLEDSSSYEAYVRAVCGVDDKSNWIGPVYFSTQCLPSTVPYVVDFEDVTPPMLPACTTVENYGSGNAWETANTSQAGFTGTVLRYKWHETRAADTWFYTNGVELDAGTEYHISYKFGNNSPEFTEKMKVGFGTTPSPSGITEILADYPEITGGSPTVEDMVFTVDESGIYYFGFHAYSSAGQFYLFLDDIQITTSLNTGNQEMISITAYPNPVSSVLNLKSSKTMDQLQVFNLLGQAVMELNPKSAETSLNMEELPSGTYILKINLEGTIETLKIIKE